MGVRIKLLMQMLHLGTVQFAVLVILPMFVKHSLSRLCLVHLRKLIYAIFGFVTGRPFCLLDWMYLIITIPKKILRILKFIIFVCCDVFLFSGLSSDDHLFYMLFLFYTCVAVITSVTVRDLLYI